MKMILGLDTGGSNTDTVIFDVDGKKLLYKGKTATTHQNLNLCISESFRQIPEELTSGLSAVCLSTTLAVNAVVEGCGCPAGLVLIGKRPEGELPTENSVLIKGDVDIKGRIRRPLDEEELERAIWKVGRRAAAIAVSGYASVRNPQLELYVKERAERFWGKPVVCAHELTRTLGFYERTVTAVLNVQIIPIIHKFIDAVSEEAVRCGIKAPIMFVRGDGSLATVARARNRPIETVFSGPAASVEGAAYLFGVENAVTMDIGGTTTDIARIVRGRVEKSSSVPLSKWKLHVPAVGTRTEGLGGDSRIYKGPGGEIFVGPERVLPFCLAAEKYRDLLEEWCQVRRRRRQGESGDEEAFVLMERHWPEKAGHEEGGLTYLLKTKPHTRAYLKKRLGRADVGRLLERLVRERVLMRIAATPTDYLRCMGGHTLGNREAAALAMELAGGWNGNSGRDGFTCIQAAMEKALGKIFQGKPEAVVMVGAPAAAWADCFGGCMGVKPVVPEHYDVAGALGAAVGKSTERLEIVIRREEMTERYLVFAPGEKRVFEKLKDATEFARSSGKKYMETISEGRRSVLEYRIWDETVGKGESEEKEIREKSCGETPRQGEIFIERRVVINAVFEEETVF